MKTCTIIGKGFVLNNVEVLFEDSKEISVPYMTLEHLCGGTSVKIKSEANKNIKCERVCIHTEKGIVFKKIEPDMYFFNIEFEEKFKNRDKDMLLYNEEKSFLVKIKRCSGGIYSWYENKIGETFEVVPYGKMEVDYISKIRDINLPAYAQCIHKRDCEVITA